MSVDNEGILELSAMRGVTDLLSAVGEDPLRDGLLETPKRVVKAFFEMTVGYSQNPAEILNKQFDLEDDDYDEMIVLRRIPFTSLCEHHLLPFSGFATVGYIPRERVVGLSKLARLVHCFAKRLQVQERLTVQITKALQEHLDIIGCGAVIAAHHSCMSCRGVEMAEPIMVTSSLLGVFREDPKVRAEFLNLAKEST